MKKTEQAIDEELIDLQGPLMELEQTKRELADAKRAWQIERDRADAEQARADGLEKHQGRVASVAEVKVLHVQFCRGSGSTPHDPIRRVEQWWLADGTMIAEKDSGAVASSPEEEG